MCLCVEKKDRVPHSNVPLIQNTINGLSQSSGIGIYNIVTHTRAIGWIAVLGNAEKSREEKSCDRESYLTSYKRNESGEIHLIMIARVRENFLGPTLI